MFTAVLFTVAKIWKQPKCPLIDKQINKLWYIYHGMLTSHKKNEILQFSTAWLDLDDITLGEVSQAEKDKHCMISLICGI